MLARIWALVIKEFLALLRDKKSRLVLIGPPIIQLVVFGYAATFDLNHIPYAVYNEDPGFASRELLGRFTGSQAFQQVATIQNEGQIAPLINQEKALLVLHIGPHFTRDLLLHHPAQVQVIIDGRNSNTATLALNYVNSVLIAFDQHWAAEHGWGKPPAQLDIRAWFNPNLLSRWFIVPGIVALLTLVVTLLVTRLSVPGNGKWAPSTNSSSPLCAPARSSSASPRPGSSSAGWKAASPPPIANMPEGGADRPPMAPPGPAGRHLHPRRRYRRRHRQET